MSASLTVVRISSVESSATVATGPSAGLPSLAFKAVRTPSKGADRVPALMEFSSPALARLADSWAADTSSWARARARSWAAIWVWMSPEAAAAAPSSSAPALAAAVSPLAAAV